MKLKSLFFALLLCNMLTYGQSGATYVNIHDTRNDVNAPAEFSKQLRLDFKSGNNDTPVNLYSATMTIAPWGDLTGGGSTQLNFSMDGLFFRKSNLGYTAWQPWRKIVMLDENGLLNLYSNDFNVNNIIANSNITTQNLVVNGYINSNLQVGDESGIGEYGKKLYFGSPFCNNDDVYISRYNEAEDVTELRVNIGDDGRDKFVVGNKYYNGNTYNKYFVVTTFGRVGINCPEPVYHLEVNGTIKGSKSITGLSENDSLYVGNYASMSSLDVDGRIKAREVLVTNMEWADFVFKKDYKLRSLQEVESHIEQHSSLPEMPTESEVNANGVDLAKMNVKLLQKVEELTLYVIQQEKKAVEQERRIAELENKIN